MIKFIYCYRFKLVFKICGRSSIDCETSYETEVTSSNPRTCPKIIFYICGIERPIRTLMFILKE
jgi:hypothetical protein